MNERLTTYDSKMTKTINNLDGELATIRAGRANPHVLDPTGGKRICPGSKDDSDPAVGKEHAQRD